MSTTPGRDGWSGAIRLLAAAGLVAILAGCAPVRRAYSGPERARAEVSRLRVSGGHVIEVDDRELFGSTVELLPGRHRLTLRFRLRGDELTPSASDHAAYDYVCLCHVTTRAGEDYRFVVRSPAPIAPSHPQTEQFAVGPALLRESDEELLFFEYACRFR